MNVRQSWAQDVVLRAMCQHIKDQCAKGTSADFILITGDLAYSGKAQEYAQMATFLDALCDASGVAKERIFCIPGNHDIDRSRQTFCFHGARASLTNPNLVDAALQPGEDMATLLQREEEYRNFQNGYFAGQERSPTEEGLGYVSWLTLEDVRLAIIGLDSAWLAFGGIDDHGKLLIGERQAINAIQLVQDNEDPAHIVIAMAHHPFHLLQEFDRQPLASRIERACHFHHCGHLHEPESRSVGPDGSGCLTLAAGASFETRQSQNSYSVVTLDLMEARRRVCTFQYAPSKGLFYYGSEESYRIEVKPRDLCSVGELAKAFEAYEQSLGAWAHYLSALILDRKSELPVQTQAGYALASISVLEGDADSDLRRKTLDFMKFRNALRIFYKRVDLEEIMLRHGSAVKEYGTLLRSICETDKELERRLDACEQDVRLLVKSTPSTSFSHTCALLADLADAQDWGLLQEQAERHLDSSDSAVATMAKRMLALSSAHAEDTASKEVSISLYRELVRSEAAEPTDFGNLSHLLHEIGEIDEAKTVVLDSLGKFPAKGDYFLEIGRSIVEATGDKEFRQQLEALIAERGKVD